jgi:hypothetical protein
MLCIPGGCALGTQCGYYIASMAVAQVGCVQGPCAIVPVQDSGLRAGVWLVPSCGQLTEPEGNVSGVKSCGMGCHPFEVLSYPKANTFVGIPSPC